MPSRKTSPITYSQAGVSIETADKLVDHLKSINPAIGGFSGMVPLRTQGMREPMLVASTDGVGTKLLVALKLGRLEKVGIDLVAMSVNDLIVCGARPLLFLDYYATGKLQISQAKSVLSGIVEGCQQTGCPLVGGETAEMPGMYHGDDLDLAGFSVGLLDRRQVIDGSTIIAGDVLLGLPSSGLHSNGYSLARKVLGETKTQLNRRPKVLGGLTVGEVLLAPTRIYVRQIMGLLDAGIKIKGMAHITGGGLPGNLNRILPAHLDALVQDGSWPVPPIFDYIGQMGPVERSELFRTFNMGIGYVLVVGKKAALDVERSLRENGEEVYRIGEIGGDGTGRVRILPN